MIAGQVESVSATVQRLVDRYIADGRAATPYEINCGLCQDLAADIIDAIDHTLRGAEVFIDDLLAGDPMDDDRVALDREKIARNWPAAALPSGISWDDMDVISEQFGFAGGIHVWVEIEGRHYDAEAVDGVDNPFDLPFFKRVFDTHLQAAPAMTP